MPLKVIVNKLKTLNKMIAQRLEDLREVMRREHLSAFIFPSTDPHQGEYVPDHWKGRELFQDLTVRQARQW